MGAEADDWPRTATSDRFAEKLDVVVVEIEGTLIQGLLGGPDDCGRATCESSPERACAVDSHRGAQL